MPKLVTQIPTDSPNESKPARIVTSNAGTPDSDSTTDAGLMVLSSSMRILHINDRARTLLSLFGETCELWPNLSPEAMPAILTEFCSHVFAELDRQSCGHEWTGHDLRRVCHMVNPALLIRGFGMPSSTGQEARMILTFQPCPPSSGILANQNSPNKTPRSTVDRASSAQ